MLQDPTTSSMMDTLAAAMRAHERATALHTRCRTTRNARLVRLALEVRQHTQHAMARAADMGIKYCHKQGIGLKQFEAEVERRKMALKG